MSFCILYFADFLHPKCPPCFLPFLKLGLGRKKRRLVMENNDIGSFQISAKTEGIQYLFWTIDMHLEFPQLKYTLKINFLDK